MKTETFLSTKENDIPRDQFGFKSQEGRNIQTKKGSSMVYQEKSERVRLLIFHLEGGQDTGWEAIPFSQESEKLPSFIGCWRDKVTQWVVLLTFLTALALDTPGKPRSSLLFLPTTSCFTRLMWISKGLCFFSLVLLNGTFSPPGRPLNLPFFAMIQHLKE